MRLARRRVSAGWLIGDAREVEGLPREAPAGTRYGDAGWIEPPRVAQCGARIAGGVGVHLGGEHPRAHLSGVMHCASIWACPTCSAVIRAERAAGVTQAVKLHGDRGGRLAFVTLTMRHTSDDDLAVTLDAALEGWRRVIRGRPWERRKEAYGLTGYVRAVEVTHGMNGWHPHLHALLFLDDAMSENERADFEAWLFVRWSSMVTKLGGGMPNQAHGVRVDVADDNGQMLAQYLAKVQEHETDGKRWDVASELVRSDVKTTRITGNRTPFELLDATDEESRRLWIEYTSATRGRRAITWSKNLRDDLGMNDERTDEEILNDTDPAPLIVGIPRETYDARRTEPHWIARVLETAETGNIPALLAITNGYRPGNEPTATAPEHHRQPKNHPPPTDTPLA